MRALVLWIAPHVVAQGHNHVQFVVGGAQKSATTSLAMELGLHSGICMHEHDSHVYESHFWERFAHDWANKSAVEGSLAENYDANCKENCTCGEKSSIYMVHQPAIVRMKAYRPRMKWILILRDPTYRAYSHYKFIASKASPPTFEELLEREAAMFARNRSNELARHRQLWLKHRGYYFRHIQFLLQHFPKPQVHIMLYDDYKENAARELAKAAAFLGLGRRGGNLSHAITRNAAPNTEPMKRGTLLRLKRHFKPHNDRLFSFLNRTNIWDPRES